MKDVLKDAERRMEKTLAFLGSKFSSVHSTINVSFLESVSVVYRKRRMPLIYMSIISFLHSGAIMIKPNDPDSVDDIEKAIRGAELGVGVVREHDSIKVVIVGSNPEKTKQVRAISLYSEDARVAIRNIRRDIKKTLESKKLSADAEKACVNEIQALTADYIEKVNQMLEAKLKVT